nr:protein phosphatase 2C domain-containing protein [Kofleriaceae bacterium]
MAGRASIVGAAVSDVGNVRSHNEDAHYFDAELGVFVVCDGMGGHAAGEVASALAVSVIREHWTSNEVLDAASRWLMKGTPETRKVLLDVIRKGVVAAHDAIVDEAKADEAKSGMGTTLVGAMVVGGDAVFAHAGDSRAYLVRDGIAMQLTEDHTLMARLMAAGVEVDTTGEGARFKSMLTNALGIGNECKVSTFVVPLADGDRFMLCSDGVSEYVPEAEVGEVLTKQPSPARAAQRLVELALERGGADNATALVVRVLEAGDQPATALQRKKDDEALARCPLLAKLSPQQRLRALRIAMERDHADNERIPAQTLGDRVAWIVLDGDVEQDGERTGPGTLLYPEALAGDRPLPDRDGLATARGEVRALALRSDDFRELCEDDEELGEVLLDGLAGTLQARLRRVVQRPVVVVNDADPRGTTDPNIRIRLPSERDTEMGSNDVPVVMTDKPIVDRTAAGNQTMPGLKRIQKLPTPPRAMPAVAPPPDDAVPMPVASPIPVAVLPAATTPGVAPTARTPAPRAPTPAPAQRAASPSPAAVAPAMASVIPTTVGPPPVAPPALGARPIVPSVMQKRATPPRGVAITPPVATPAVGGSPPKLPPLPKLRASTEPPVAPSPVPEAVDDPPSQSIEVDLEHDDDDGPKTHVGPPPVDDDDDAPPLELPTAVMRPPTQPQVLELEPEAKLDIDPEDAAEIEKRKRKKRLTEGWDE